MRNYLTIAIALLLSSCYTEKQAQKELTKANDKYPYKVAEFTRTNYPCFDFRDTVVMHDTSYDFIEIQCPDGGMIRIDTVFAEKYAKKPPVDITRPFKVIAVPGITKIVNSYIRDSAEINLLEYRVKACAEEQVVLWRSNDKKSEWIKWLIIILAVSILGNIFQYFKK